MRKNMIVVHEKLWVVKEGWGWSNCFAYSQEAEAAVANLLGHRDAVLTEGNFPGYDYEHNGMKYEVKFQRTNGLRLEYRQSKSGKPSGVATTTADKWIVISTGLTMEGKLVGKIRAYDADVLREVVEQLVDPDSDGNTIVVNPKEVPHKWLGDVHFDSVARAWDLTSWTRKAR
jgi:hypothetical protein